MIATGYRNKFDVVPGLGPDGYAQTITTLADAEKAAVAWAKFLGDPGPVGSAQPRARAASARRTSPCSTPPPAAQGEAARPGAADYLTAAPFLGHFGIGGLPGGEKLLKMSCAEGITAVTGMAMDEVTGDQVKLADGTRLPFRYAMVVPPSSGRTSCGPLRARRGQGLRARRGRLPAEGLPGDLRGRHRRAGTRALQTAVPIGIPKTGFPVESMARSPPQHRRRDEGRAAQQSQGVR